MDSQAQNQVTYLEDRNGDDFREVDTSSDIAIVAMSGRFPGAESVDQLWQNLKAGLESITVFSDEELLAAGVAPSLLKNPNYVKANPVLKDIDCFDARFFDINPREAEILDPQQRLFLECAWEAVEQAGYDPQRYPGLIGVYAGIGVNGYLLNNLIQRPDLLESLGIYRLVLASGKDFLSSRVAYKLNLKGAAVSLQTACSTSLVAVHLACQSLLNGEVDMVLTGGVSIRIPHVSGYLYQEGMILSPDGHCRAFDADAQGTLGSSGVAVVVLKRLEDAIADGDHCYAVIKGSAINNDGSLKVGYTAPGVEGQAAVISEALAIANVEAESIQYIEAHGTGTELGDPIEMAALNRVFRQQTDKQQFCAIGSLKTNLGHMDATAGIAGLIKTSLALKHQSLPPSLNFESPNPNIDFDNSPFYVNTQLQSWPRNGHPRRAGVSSFGIGGTNAHVIVEEAPEREASGPARPWQLILLSAKTMSALDRATMRLVEHLKQSPELPLADVAYTLSCGRQAFDHRRMLVAQDTAQVIETLGDLNPSEVFTHSEVTDTAEAVFLFPGQGAQHIHMGRALYEEEPLFRATVDTCAEIFQPLLNQDLRQLLYPQGADQATAETQLRQTALAQPALFVIEYALAQLWLAWGITPKAMLGHSIGEYVAACLAGVFTLEEGLTLVARRGQMMQQLPSGSMLSVALAPDSTETILSTDSRFTAELSVAVINEPNRCVVSGPDEAISALEQHLSNQTIESRRLQTSHGFHSAMMDPILEPFRQHCQQIKWQSPQIPYISNLTGTWITNEQAVDPNYWVQHLRQPVRFSEGIHQLYAELSEKAVLLEVGPSRNLSSLAKRHPARTQQQVLASLRHPQEQASEVATVFSALGQLWLGGVPIDWPAVYSEERRYRVPLPTYPFEHQRYWLDAMPTDAVRHNASEMPELADLKDWFYLPAWKQRALPPPVLEQSAETLLIFQPSAQWAEPLLQRLTSLGHTLIRVDIGETFAQLTPYHFSINPRRREDYGHLLQTLQQAEQQPSQVLHLWTLTPASHGNDLETIETSQIYGFYSLLFLVQAWGEHYISQSCELVVITQHLYEVTGEEPLEPLNATLLGAVQTIPQENPNLSCRCVDIVLPSAESPFSQKLTEQLVTEILVKNADSTIAYRGRQRWIQGFEAFPLGSQMSPAPVLKNGSTYLITGGLGGLGLSLAKHLTQRWAPKLILLSRSPFPQMAAWDDWLADHEPDDPVAVKIKNLQDLEQAGAKVCVITADVCKLDQLKPAIEEVIIQFGPIQGLIHAAGVPGGEIMSQRTEAAAAAVMAPKVQGTLNLEQVLADQPLDFVVLCSSLTAVTGGIGQIDYCAANAFLDAYARSRDRAATRYLSINWDSLQEVGMAATALDHLRQQLANKPTSQWLLDRMQTELSQGILPDDSGEVLARLLSQPEPQVIVSTRNLDARLAAWDQQHLQAQSGMSAAATAAMDRLSPQDLSEDQVEATIIEIFQTLLGVDSVGVNDNFFDLGGDSLIGTQLIFHVKQTFDINLPIVTLFNTPTIAHLAELIKAQLQLPTAASELDTLSDLLDQVETLSDDEIYALSKNTTDETDLVKMTGADLQKEQGEL
ncbi:MAG: SDR family NAD(P)-dependent oxidoreductase [Cyanobacteria bacterium P01_H01_bin.21]